MWILSGSPLLSILLDVLTVSPNKQYLQTKTMTGSNSDPIMFYNGTGIILEKIGRHHIIFPNAPNLHVNKTKKQKDTIAYLTMAMDRSMA